MEIIPAILAQTETELRDKLAAVPPRAAWVHVDFVDLPSPPFLRGSTLAKRGGRGGEGVEQTTPSQGNLPLIKGERNNNFFLEAHLMLPDSRSSIDDLVRAGFSRVIVQTEALSPEAFAELLHEWRGAVEIAPSLELGTSLSSIDSFAHELKSVQLMGIAEIGAQGRPFDTRVIERVHALHTKYPHLTISVDGGVNKKNADQLITAGATRLVVGSALKEFYG